MLIAIKEVPHQNHVGSIFLLITKQNRDHRISLLRRFFLTNSITSTQYVRRSTPCVQTFHFICYGCLFSWGGLLDVVMGPCEIMQCGLEAAIMVYN